MIRTGSVLLLLVLLAVGCAKKEGPEAEKKPATSTASPQASAATTTASPEAATVKTDDGSLRPGEATGSFTSRGETVELRYAYAGRGKRFGNEATIVLIVDKPIPENAVPEELASQTLLLDGKIKGLEYVLDKDGYWVRFHPSQYQESKSNDSLKFTVEGDTVRGSDEDKGELNDGKYSRSFKFAATIIK